jgi:redox-sensitive bicupin YhaK (pirin superfamily)
MIPQPAVKMFLADERGVSENEWFRSYHTFNFGNYFNEHKYPLDDVYIINDDSLDAGRSLRMLIEEDSYIILLPVIGAIAYKDSPGDNNLAAAGQVVILAPGKGEVIEISNPFDEGIVNFLQIWIKTDTTVARASHQSTYHINECINGLQKISPPIFGSSSLPFILSIGKFKGRGESNYHFAIESARLFVFVVEGAFEVEGRLLHARDGLAFTNAQKIEIEALSNEAIILLIESLPA